jgi:hypothetical protein
VTLLRHLVSAKIEAPLWRRSRPHLLIEGATYARGDAPATGTLMLDAYVRHVGLSANQLLAVPTAGDFQIDKIWAAPEQICASNRRPQGMAQDSTSDLALLAEANESRCVHAGPKMCLLQHLSGRCAATAVHRIIPPPEALHLAACATQCCTSPPRCSTERLAVAHQLCRRHVIAAAQTERR